MHQLPVLPSGSDLEILTPRLRQEPIRRTHARILFPVLSDPGLYEFTGGAPPVSEERLSELYAGYEWRRSPDGTAFWLNWLLVEREEEAAIGYTQATVHPTHAYVAWVVGTRWQNRGFASEAAGALVAWLRALGVPEIRACVKPTHIASGRVAGKAGLVRTSETIDGEEVWAVVFET